MYAYAFFGSNSIPFWSFYWAKATWHPAESNLDRQLKGFNSLATRFEATKGSARDDACCCVFSMVFLWKALVMFLDQRSFAEETDWTMEIWMVENLMNMCWFMCSLDIQEPSNNFPVINHGNRNKHPLRMIPLESNFLCSIGTFNLPWLYDTCIIYVEYI